MREDIDFSFFLKTTAARCVHFVTVVFVLHYIGTTLPATHFKRSAAKIATQLAGLLP
jgi:hypothetical protein